MMIAQHQICLTKLNKKGKKRKTIGFEKDVDRYRKEGYLARLWLVNLRIADAATERRREKKNKNEKQCGEIYFCECLPRNGENVWHFFI